MLCQFAAGLDKQGDGLIHVVETEGDIDREIAALQRRYYELLLAEMEQQHQQLSKQYERLILAEREAERWKTRYEILKEQTEKDE